MKQQLLNKLTNAKAVIGVVGLGYVGLPLCRVFVRGGATVLGFDVAPKKIEAIDAKKTYIEHIPDETIAEMVESCICLSWLFLVWSEPLGSKRLFLGL